MQDQINELRRSDTIIGDCAIRTYTKGRGTPVFLLHGWGGSIESWVPLMEEMGDEENTFFAIDFPGFGETKEPSVPWGVKEYSDLFINYVQKMYSSGEAVGECIIVVHSFGGRVLLKSAEMMFKDKKFPCKGVVIIAGAGVKRPPSFRARALARALLPFKMFERFLPSKMTTLCKKLFYRCIGATDYNQVSGVMKETFKNVIAEDLSDQIEQIKCSTLIFWGEHDSYVPVDDGVLMHEKIPGSKLVVFADGRHGIHKTHAIQIAREIQSFFKDIS